MNDKIQLLVLLQSKQLLNQEINSIIYGTIEVRQNKYIYVHYRENGLPITKYVGEYSDEMYNQILANNFTVKEYKRIIKDINRKLKIINYKEGNISNSVKNNVDFAKRNLVDTIYNQAILEGISTTFPDTENIIENGIINNMNSQDVLKIINLKHCWEFILNENILLTKSNYYLLCEINKFVLEGFYYSAGKIRCVPVNIGGTQYKPSIPIEDEVKEEIDKILIKNIDDIDKTIELLLYIMKRQIFIDGNKRTSIIFANHYLISKGKGIISINSSLVEKFKELLIDYYETDNSETIAKFIRDNCYKRYK